MSKKQEYPKQLYLDAASVLDHQAFFKFPDVDSMNEYLDDMDQDEVEIAEYKFVGLRKMIRKVEVKIV